jgi:hypothetical protein
VWIFLFYEKAELAQSFGGKQKNYTDWKEVWIFYFQAGTQ